MPNTIGEQIRALALRIDETLARRHSLVLVTMALSLSLIIYSTLSHEPLGVIGRGDNQVVPLHWSASQVEQWAGRADVGRYILGAKILLERGRFHRSTINLWPPGHTTIVAALIRFTGEAYFPAKILVLNWLAWLFALWMVRDSLVGIRSELLRMVICFAPFYYGFIRSWLFGYGLLGSEALAHPLFVVSICFYLRWTRSGAIQDIAGMAIVMAMLAYLRGYFEMFGNILIVAFIGVVVARCIDWLIIRHRNRLSGFETTTANALHRRKLFDRRLKVIGFGLLILVLLLAPWRAYNVERGVSLSWIHAEYYWTAIWRPDRAVTPNYLSLGINIPCHVDLELCEALHASKPEFADAAVAQAFFKKMTIVTFLTHPLQWYAHRLKYFDRFWFGASWDDLLKTRWLLFIEGMVLLLAAAIGAAYALLRLCGRSSVSLNLLLLFVGLFVLFNCVVFTFLHFSYRYSIFLRLFCAYLPFWIWAASMCENTRSLIHPADESAGKIDT